MFSVLCSTSKQAFSKCKFLSPGETKPVIWKPSAMSSPVSSEELRGCERQPSTTFPISYGKQGISIVKWHSALEGQGKLLVYSRPGEVLGAEMNDGMNE